MLFLPSKTILRDWRQPRDWKRLWRDPPGFFYPNCACCGVCVNCANLQLNDTFINDIGYQRTICGTETGGVVTFTIGNHLCILSQTGTYSGPNPVMTTGIIVPALNGLCLSVCANVSVFATGAVTGGVTIGLCGVAFIRSVGTMGVWGGAGAVDVNGCLTGAGTFTTPGVASVPGKVSLVIQDTSGGAGTYSQKTYFNGTLVETRAGVALPALVAGNTIQMGIVGDTHGVTWTQLTLAKN